MARTMLNPSNQIASSVVYNAMGSAGTNLQSGALTVEDDLNALRAQVNRILDATLGGNWYDDIPTTADGKKRSVKQLNAGLDTIESKTLLARVSVATSVAVPSGQNYVVLSAANSQTPSVSIAVGAMTLGAVAAQSTLNAAGFSAHELTAVAGNTSAQPRNLLIVRDATTLQVVESTPSGSTIPYDVYGLLQVESTAVDGAAFNDTSAGNRGKISFVTVNPSTGALQACPAADVAGRTLQYAYVLRNSLAMMPEQNFLGNAGFQDQIGTVDVTLSRAEQNQAGSPIPTGTDVLWRIANGVNFKLQNNSGSVDLFGVSPTASGNSAVINTDTLAINTTSPVTSTRGISVATGGQAISIGTAAGAISSNGNLSVTSLGSNTLALGSGGTLTLTDGYEAASGWTSSAIALSASSAEWSNFKTYYGEASVLNSIVQAGQKASHSVKWASVTASTVPAGTNLTGAGAAANLDAQLLNYAGMTNYATQVKLYCNGVLLRPGATATDTSKDWYPGTTPATGDVKLTFAVRGTAGAADILTTEIFGNPLDAA